MCSVRCAFTESITSPSWDGLAKFKAARKSHLVDIEAVFGSRYSPAELAAVSSLLGRLLDSDALDIACTKEPE